MERRTEPEEVLPPPRPERTDGDGRAPPERRTWPPEGRPVDGRTDPRDGRAPPERRTSPPEGRLPRAGRADPLLEGARGALALADGRARLDGAARGEEDRGAGAPRTAGEDRCAPPEGRTRDEGARAADGAPRAAEPLRTLPPESRSEGRRAVGAELPRAVEGRAAEGRPAGDRPASAETRPRPPDTASEGRRGAVARAAGDALRDGARVVEGVTAELPAVPRRDGAAADPAAVPRREGAAALRAGALCRPVAEERDAGWARGERPRTAGPLEACALRAGSL